MTREYKQPAPGWRGGNADALTDGPAFEDERSEPLMPIAQGEHHSISKDFILAGRAVFTVSGQRTRFTFKVNRKDAQPGSRYQDPTYFVSVLTRGGGDEDRAYSYVGILRPVDGSIVFTKGSKIQPSAPAAKALVWTMKHVWAGKALPAPAAVYHEGRCGRCGRPLTDPESILRGFGPECAQVVGAR